MIKKSILFLLLMFLCPAMGFGAEGKVDVKLDPLTPIAGEPFSLVFTIETNFSGDPYISFEPSNNLTVQGKRNLGVSISTTLINGKFSTKRTIKIAYEMFAERVGNYYVKDILVDLGGNNIEVDRVRFKVVKTPPKPKDIFVQAEVSKEDAYLGEGIDVNYYLYYLVPVSGTEIKAFPKLKKFLKRFYMIKDRVESVEYNGRVYKRLLKYSARVFPDEVGTLTIDPLKLSVQYGARNTNSPFGNFGLTFRNFKTRTFQSRPVKIKVNPLPADNVPSDFTGLIGKHDFNLIPGRSRYLVNEPIEVKMEIRGPGALEKMEAPQIYTHQSLEKFDTKSELLELEKRDSRKVVEYTYLAREAVNIAPFKKTLSYFEPSDGTYKRVELNIPGITIGGSAVAARNQKNQGDQSSPVKTKEDQTPSMIEHKVGLVGPIFKLTASHYSGYYLRFFNLVLLGLLAWGIWTTFFVASPGEVNFVELKKNIDKMKLEGVHYSGLFDIIDTLNNKVKGHETRRESLESIVAGSDLSDSAKKYFVNLIDCTEKGDFQSSEVGNKGQVSFEEEHFKELYKLIESIYS